MSRAVPMSHPDVAGVTYVAASPDRPRPHVGILGAIHGDEPCGLAVIQRLRDEVERGALAPSAGTWVLIHGNPEATGEVTRHTRGGADLNRLFDYAFERDLPRSRWSPEHERAHALRPILEDLDALLDLHSASWPTPPFAIINEVPEAAALARRLGFDFVTQGWSGPGLLMEKVTIGVMQRRGRPGVSVECGQHRGEGTVDAAWDCTLRFLRAAGVLEGEAPEGAPTFLEIVEIISRPSPGFSFTRTLRGLERLDAGDVFAADRVAELRTRAPCYVLLPNDTVEVGCDMVFLARPAQT